MSLSYGAIGIGLLPRLPINSHFALWYILRNKMNEGLGEKKKKKREEK